MVSLNPICYNGQLYADNNFLLRRLHYENLISNVCHNCFDNNHPISGYAYRIP